MKQIILILMPSLLLIAVLAGAMDTIEGPKKCTQCGMDRTAFAQSRMLIVYADGVAVGVCSLHCAAAELNDAKDKQVKSLMVADYVTKKLLDAREAIWVVGGKKRGVMTLTAKWAFADLEAAKRFVAENGGFVDSFDRLMNSATMEVLQQAAEKRAVENEMLRELR